MAAQAQVAGIAGGIEAVADRDMAGIAAHILGIADKDHCRRDTVL